MLTGQLSGIFIGNTPAIGAMAEAFGGVFGEAELIAPEARRITVLDVNWFGVGAVDVDE